MKKETVLEVGQTVYGKPGINTSRYDKSIIEGEIKKVGRKYLEVQFGGRIFKYYKDTLEQVSEYVADYYLYFSKEEILEEEAYSNNVLEIKLLFSAHSDHTLKEKGITLEKTKKILEILNS